VQLPALVNLSQETFRLVAQHITWLKLLCCQWERFTHQWKCSNCVLGSDVCESIIRIILGLVLKGYTAHHTDLWEWRFTPGDKSLGVQVFY